MNIADRILAAGNDTAPAILTAEGVTTYRDLRGQAQRVASALLARGHKKGQRIGILAENSPFFVSAYLGIIRAGLVAVPMQADLAPAAQDRIARDSGMSELLVSHHLGSRALAWAHSANVACLTQAQLENLDQATTEFPEIDAASDLAALMFTSGSTGAPKAVMVSHRNIECNTRDIIGYLGLEPRERVMVVLPFHYCFGLSLLHTHLMAGASLVLNNHFKLFPQEVIDAILETQCTGFAGVPSTYQILLRRTNFTQVALPKLRCLQQAGGKLPDACIKKLLQASPGVKFFLMYGQTEATARLSYLPPERLVDKMGSIGKGLPSTHLEVLKPDGTPVQPGSGETGEIVASGNNIALGYWNDPQETAAFFKDGKLRTGDLARVDEDGFIFFVERERDLLKPGGNRISAREIEDVLVELEEVVEAAVVGVPHELLGEAMLACVVLRPDSLLDSAALEAHCRKRLPSFKVPQEFWLLNELPHNSAGKVQKTKLREQAKSRMTRANVPARIAAAVPRGSEQLTLP